ncbi:DUF3592 domain-containing protein [Streptomyces sp. NPDC007088]|uniref:DUF3592 domain-containing protein n=1 Tax=Streptomyces sp. NPDC007088 TaxID=3364773 RepID=UPI0036C7EB47
MEDDGFGLVFGLLGGLFAALGAGGIIGVLVSLSRRRRTLATGRRAEATVVDTYVTRRENAGFSETDTATRTERRALLEFSAADGRRVRFEETSGKRVRGDVVPVRYPADHPERAVCVDSGPGGRVGTVFLIAFLIVFTALGLYFASLGFGGHDGFGGSDAPDGLDGLDGF